MVSATPAKRLVLVQFAGDFRDADRVLRDTGQETYYGHRYILETLAGVQQQGVPTTIICCRTQERYCESLVSGVTAVGLAADPYQETGLVATAIQEMNPTHVIFLGPMYELMSAVLKDGARIACIWADSFPARGLRAIRERWRLRRQLNHDRIEWVGNHGRNACRALVGLGVDPAKVFAWDYLHDEDPEEFPPRGLPNDPAPQLFFAGTIVDSKGVYDLLEAVAILRARDVPVSLRVAGHGETERFGDLVSDLGISDAVTFLGLLHNTEVLAEMRNATAVVIPSWPSYAEGQPLTINEALRARTPIIASDHPMFEGILEEPDSAVVFPAADVSALASAITRLHNNADLYARLSSRAPQTWRHMAVETKWGDLVSRWARDAAEDRAWFNDRAGEFAGRS